MQQTIFETLRQEILDGKFAEQEKFPSEESLRRRFKTSWNTLRLALSRLKESGFIETRNGAGTFLSTTARNMTGRLGLIIPSIAGGEISPPICAAISEAARENGYSLLFGSSSSPDPKIRESRAIALAHEYVEQHVAGVFLEPIERTNDPESVSREIIMILSANHIPVVLLDRVIVEPPNRSEFDVIGLDNVQIGYRLACHMLKQGARRICFCALPCSAPTIKMRVQGVKLSVLDAGLSWTSSNVCIADCDDMKTLRRLFASRNPPDAIICGNDITAISLLKRLSSLKIKVPRDCLVAGVDDVRLAALSNPPLTTIRQPCREIGRAAVTALIERIRTPSIPPRQILLDAPLVIRKSTTSAKRSKLESSGRSTSYLLFA